MKKSIKIASVLCAAMLAVGGVVGCGGNGGSGKKTELNIGVFNGGLGYQWAKDLEKEFEELYKDVSFEPGKVGVDVVIDPKKDLYKTEAIKSAIKNNNGAKDIYYTCYELYRECANEGLAYNITDILNENVYLANGEMADMTYDADSKKYVLNEGATAPVMSMLDKMNDTWKESYYYDDNSAITAGYYAIPYESSIMGFVYDYDLFQEKGWLDYDGIDGTPSTMAEFWELLDRIVEANMIPVTGFPYWKGVTSAYMGQYEGFDAAALNYTYDGEYTFRNLPQTTLDVFTDAFCQENNITNNGDGTYTVTITPGNAWLLAYQSGKDSYIKWVRQLSNIDYIDSNIYKQSYDYSAAQSTFVLSKLNKRGQKRIAMIVEGEWWENEARAYFNSTGGYGSRDFRYMALPTIEGQTTGYNCVGADALATDLIVNAKTKNIELVRLWLQYSHSETALENFTLTNGVTRNSFKYDLSDEQQSKLTPFGRCVYQMKMGIKQYSNVKAMYPTKYSDRHVFATNTTMGGFGTIISSLVMGERNKWDAIGTYLISFFNKHIEGINNQKDVTAEEFIDKMHEYYSKEYWEQAYRSFQGVNN